MQRSIGRMQRSRCKKTPFLAKKHDILSGFTHGMVTKHQSIYAKTGVLGSKTLAFSNMQRSR